MSDKERQGLGVVAEILAQRFRREPLRLALTWPVWDNTMRAETRFSRHLNFRLFNNICVKLPLWIGSNDAVAGRARQSGHQR